MLSSLFFVIIRIEKSLDFWDIFFCICYCLELWVLYLIRVGYNDLVWFLIVILENRNNLSGIYLY